MESTRALNRETLYAASKDLEYAAKNRGKPPKKKKKAAASAAAVVIEGPAEEKKEEQAATALKTKVDKKRKSSSSPHESAPSSNGIKAAAQPGSLEKETSKKAKKTKAATVTAAVGEEKPSVSPIAEQPPSTSSGSKKIKKKNKKSEAAVEAGDITPIVSPTAAAFEAAEARRKNVRFSLKRNLVMTIGQPPLPEDVRTPPTSKPKGSALKVKVNAHRHIGSALGKKKPAAAKRLIVEAPSSAPPKYNLSNTINGSNGKKAQGNGKKRSPVGTRSVAKAKIPRAGNGTRNSDSGGGGSGGKRPRASDFF